MIKDKNSQVEYLRRLLDMIGLDYSNCDVLGISPLTLQQWKVGAAKPNEGNLYELIAAAGAILQRIDEHQTCGECHAIFLPHGIPKIPHKVDTGRKYRGPKGRERRIQEARAAIAERFRLAGFNPSDKFIARMDVIPPDGSHTGKWAFKHCGNDANGCDIFTQEWQDGDETQGILDTIDMVLHVTPLPVNSPNGMRGKGRWQYNEGGKTPYAIWIPDTTAADIDSIMDDIYKTKQANEAADAADSAE